MSAQKNEEELSKSATGSLPPLQRVPNSIITSDDSDTINMKNGLTEGNEESNGMLDDIQSEVTNGLSDMSKIPENITNVITQQKEALSSQYDKAIDKIEDKAEDMIVNVSEKVEDVKSGINGNVEKLKEQADNLIKDSNMPSWIKSPAEGALKQVGDGISSGMNKFMDKTSEKSLQEKPKFDSVDNLLQEIEDDLCSSKSSTGDTVSMISNGNYFHYFLFFLVRYTI